MPIFGSPETNLILMALQVASFSHVLVLPPAEVGGDGNSVVVLLLVVGAVLHVDAATGCREDIQ